MGAIGGTGVSIEEALPLDGSRSMTDTLTVDQDGDSSSLVIDSEATTGNVIEVISAQSTTGTILRLGDADALTSGNICAFTSNSASTSTRNLVNIVNDNTLATGTACLNLVQDAAQKIVVLTNNATAAGSSYIDFRGTAAANTTGPISTLTTSGAIQGHVQMEINGVKRWLAFLADPS